MARFVGGEDAEREDVDRRRATDRGAPVLEEWLTPDELADDYDGWRTGGTTDDLPDARYVALAAIAWRRRLDASLSHPLRTIRRGGPGRPLTADTEANGWRGKRGSVVHHHGDTPTTPDPTRESP